MIEVNRIIQGDVLEVLKTLPDESIDCCITSPPYWGLRDYGTAKWEGGNPECDHVETDNLKRGNSGGLSNNPQPRGEQPHTESSKIKYKDICGKCGAKRIDSQIGLEKTPEEYVNKMVEVFREVRRVLKNTGTLWLNIGDSYAGATAIRTNPKEHSGILRFPSAGDSDRKRGYLMGDGLKPKDLCGIPWKVAFALQADGWWLRQDIIWQKLNPMPESVTDRCTKSHEYVFLLTKSAKYYYDAEAIREKVGEETRRAITFRNDRYIQNETFNNSSGFKDKIKDIDGESSLNGRNKRSVWSIATQPFQPFPEAHFATFPEDLIEPMIKAGTSEKGICPDCGKAWERIIKKERIKEASPSGNSEIERFSREDTDALGGRMTEPITIGWQASCSCNKLPVPSTVLDPFAGSGTTCLVARKLLRNYIGIELNPKYVEMAEKRLGKIPIRLDKFRGNNG